MFLHKYICCCIHLDTLLTGTTTHVFMERKEISFYDKTTTTAILFIMYKVEKERKKKRKKEKEEIRAGCLFVQGMQIKYIVVRKGTLTALSWFDESP